MKAIRHVVSVVGARPNFMKIAPVVAALARDRPEAKHTLVHTGQHYDRDMSRVFLDELGLKAPDYMLDVGSGSHAVQTARVMERIEPILEREAPDVILVPGDVNSTLAAALVAAKLGISVAHIEAGLRSFDRSMPEELNRLLTDQLSDYLFVHSPEAEVNLLREGVPRHRIYHVGNTMIDTLVKMRPLIDGANVPAVYGLPPTYVAVTLHRPALVDGALLERVVGALDKLSSRIPVVFPVHPRTRASMSRQGISFQSEAVRILDPLPYIDFLSLVTGATAVITDSGGIQEETTYLGVPCFTLRDNTERPVTCDLGTNVLLGLSPERICEVPDLLTQTPQNGGKPPGWDGDAATRLVKTLFSDSEAYSTARDGTV
jgi:UDP-N-acetylglucosamine 2-epimerase (non-hydrolysing)